MKKTIIRKDGTMVWYVDDYVHREDGPAIERPNGQKLWFINGKPLTEEEFHARIDDHSVLAILLILNIILFIFL